jgi:CRP-like cAMP-binding protein
MQRLSNPRSSTRPFRPRNQLLAALAPPEFKRLYGRLERVDLSLRDVVSSTSGPIAHVYFPETGMISLIQRMADGAVTEVGLIGREGFVGIPVLLGASVGLAEANVQMKGSALRMTAKAFRQAIARNEGLKTRLLGFAHALHGQVTQTAACNSRHPVQKRLARWLLMAHDCAEGDELVLSHEFLSIMLGTRRPSVTMALGKMRSAGLVTTGHGRVIIRDRRGLEAAACECYGTVRKSYRTLLN